MATEAGLINAVEKTDLRELQPRTSSCCLSTIEDLAVKYVHELVALRNSPVPELMDPVRRIVCCRRDGSLQVVS